MPIPVTRGQTESPPPARRQLPQRVGEALRAAALGNPAWSDNWTSGGRTPHMEIISGRRVWLAQAPCTVEIFDRLQVPEGFLKSGVGNAVADVAYFGRSPDADVDGPLETIEVGGIRFAYVARPGRPETGHEGVLVLPVHKHHRVLYRAGRVLEVMDAGDGADYVPLAASARPDAPPRRLPAGWSIREITLARDLVVDLPCPTRVTFFPSGDSFQGPVRLGS